MSGLFWGFPGGICSTAENALPQMLTSKGKGAFCTAMSLAHTVHTLFVTGSQHCKPLATCSASDLDSEPLGNCAKESCVSALAVDLQFGSQECTWISV